MPTLHHIKPLDRRRVHILPHLHDFAILDHKCCGQRVLVARSAVIESASLRKFGPHVGLHTEDVQKLDGEGLERREQPLVCRADERRVVHTGAVEIHWVASERNCRVRRV